MYGYEASLEGVQDMLAAFQSFLDDPQVNANREAINRLIGVTKAPQGAPQKISAIAKAKPRMRAPLRVSAKDGYWVVVGGKKSGGIIVRIGESTTSNAQRELLATDAVVKMVQHNGIRMNYEKIS